MEGFLSLRQVAQILNRQEQHIRLLDTELEPVLTPRGTKQVTRWYRPEVIERFRVQGRTTLHKGVSSCGHLLAPLCGCHSWMRRKCACGCGGTPARNRKYCPGCVRRRRISIVLTREPMRRARKDPNNKRFGLNQRYMQTYGITLDQVISIFVQQGEVCGCCGIAEPGHDTGWNVDHDHVTKQIRGVICQNCNQFISRGRDPATGERDNLAALEVAYLNARDYLLRVEAQEPVVINEERRKASEYRFLQAQGRKSQRAQIRAEEDKRKRERAVVRERDRVLAREREEACLRIQEGEAFVRVRRALGAVILASLDQERARKLASRRPRDIATMGVRIGMTRGGLSYGPVENEVRAHLTNGWTWRKIGRHYDIPASTLRSRHKHLKVLKQIVVL